MVLTEGQQTDRLPHNCYACKHALIAAERAMKTASSDENYGALPSSYRKLRKSKSMVTPRLSRSRSQPSPLIHVKRSLGRLRPTWRPPGRLDPLETTPTPRRHSRYSGHQTSLLDPGAQQPVLGGNQPITNTVPAGGIDPLSRSQTGTGVPFNHGTNQITPRKIRPTHWFDFRDEGSRGSRLSSRERFFMRCKAEARDKIAEKQPKSIKKSLSAQIQQGFAFAMKGSLKKKSNSPSQKTGHSCQSDERNMASGFDDYEVTDEDISHRSNIIFGNDEEEAVDKFARDLRPSSSRDSLHSNARSRVTSWTNSSMTGSVALRSGPLDRNRLSVIKEDGGPHQPSSSAGRHIGGVGIFQEPLPSTTNDGQTLLSIDSQRVYSALIKRIKKEEEEVETTAAALEAVNLEKGVPTLPSRELVPTICIVKSDQSLSCAAYTDSQPQLGDQNFAEVALDTAPVLEQYEGVTSRVEQHLPAGELYPSFLPFSVEQKHARPSPFRKLLGEKRKYNYSSVSSQGDGSVLLHQHPPVPRFDRTRFGNSSDSIYSRATDGWPDDSYISPGGSSSSLILPPIRLSKSRSMVEQVHTMRIVSKSTSPLFTVAKNTAETSESNAHPDTRNVNVSSHVREQAQLPSEDNKNKIDRIASESRCSRSGSEGLGLSVGHPNLTSLSSDNGGELRVPTATGGRMKLLFKRATSDKLWNSFQLPSGEDRRSNDGNGRAQRLHSGPVKFRDARARPGIESHRKENQSADQHSTPPLSTPGRLQLQSKNSSRNGKLQKRASEVLFNSRKDLYSTPTSDPRTMSVTFSDAEDSPAQRAKARLVARLSRPFDMDVPPHNRPFDSMYLGKRTPGHADTLGNSRLSVAPRTSKSYGGLRMPDEETGGDTALAIAPSSSSISRNASKVLGLFSSKRMVSNFLKSRRMQRRVSADERDTFGGGPTFI